MIKAEGDAIVLNQMRFADEVKKPSGLNLPHGTEVPEKELDLALKLIGELSRPFDVKEFRDTYTEELKGLIEDKVKGKERKVRREKAAPTKAQELVSKLLESIEYARK